MTATVFGQIADEPVHYGKVGGVDELSALPTLRNQAGSLKVLKMEREGGGYEAHTLTDRAGR
jgi:hypothetical protein